MKILILSLLIILLYYWGYRTWQILPFNNFIKGSVVFVGIALFFSILFVFLFREYLSIFITKWLYYLSSSWMVIMLYMLMIFVVLDILKIFIPKISIYTSNSSIGSIILFSFLLIIFFCANLKYHQKERVEIDIEIDKYLENNIKIVAISDLHLGYTIGKKELSTWIDLINKEKADIVLIAGDIVDNDPYIVLKNKMYDELNKIESSMGVYACLGNHEYIGGEANEQKLLKQTNIRLLRDKFEMIDSLLYIVGRDDRSNKNRASLKNIIRNIDKSKPIILIDHQPYNLEEAEKEGIDLQVSGHTHKGQIFPLNLIVDYIYEQGHGYHKKSNTHYYVSSGIGIWGAKFRIGTQSEYLVINLKSKQKSNL